MRAVRVGGTGAMLLLLGGSVMLTGPLAIPAGAATFNVTNANDSGAGSLRQALADAASAAGPNTVVVPAGLGTIVLNSEISWSSKAAVTITGNGATINLNGQPRGLIDAAGKGVTVDGLTLTGGSGTTPNDAAPIVSEGGALTVSNCTISGNHVTATTGAGDVAGGVLSEGGPVSITGCTITGNTATGPNDAGGGVNSEGGSVDITDSTVTANTATTTGGEGAGGVLSEGGPVIVANSTISGNTGTTSGGDAGGGVLSEGGAVTARTAQINCNSAATSAMHSDAGGGINSLGGNVTTNDGSIVGNTASATGGGTSANSVLSVGGAVSLGNTTVSDSTTSCVPAPTPTTTTTTTTTAPATTTTTTTPATTTTAPAAAARAVAATPAFTG